MIELSYSDPVLVQTLAEQSAGLYHEYERHLAYGYALNVLVCVGIGNGKLLEALRYVNLALDHAIKHKLYHVGKSVIENAAHRENTEPICQVALLSAATKPRNGWHKLSVICTPQGSIQVAGASKSCCQLNSSQRQGCGTGMEDRYDRAGLRVNSV